MCLQACTVCNPTNSIYCMMCLEEVELWRVSTSSSTERQMHAKTPISLVHSYTHSPHKHCFHKVVSLCNTFLFKAFVHYNYNIYLSFTFIYHGTLSTWLIYIFTIFFLLHENDAVMTAVSCTEKGKITSSPKKITLSYNHIQIFDGWRQRHQTNLACSDTTSHI